MIDSADVHIRSSIEEYQTIEKQLLAHAKNEALAGSASDPWIADLSRLSTDLLNRPLRELMNRRAEVYVNHILPNLKAGKIGLKKGVSAHYVTTRVDYATETFFAQEATQAKSRDYTYLIFKKGSEVIDGRWITPPEERPDFLWIPQNQKDSLIGAKELAPEVQELLHLGKHCRKVADLIAFLTFIKNAITDGVMTTQEKGEIQNRYQDLSSFVDTQELRKIFKESKLHGVDVSDILPVNTEEN